MSFNSNGVFNISRLEKKEEIIRVIKKFGSIRELPGNYYIVKEGDKSNHIYLLLSGAVDVLKKDHNNSEFVITSLDQGSIFGEMSIFMNSKRTASIRTQTKVTLVQFSNQQFIDALSSSAILMFHLLESFSEKIKNDNELLKQAIDDKIVLTISGYILIKLAKSKEKNLNSNHQQLVLDLNELSQKTGLDISKLLIGLRILIKKHLIISETSYGRHTHQLSVNFNNLNDYFLSLASME